MPYSAVLIDMKPEAASEVIEFIAQLPFRRVVQSIDNGEKLGTYEVFFGSFDDGDRPNLEAFCKDLHDRELCTAWNVFQPRPDDGWVKDWWDNMSNMEGGK